MQTKTAQISFTLYQQFTLGGKLQTPLFNEMVISMTAWMMNILDWKQKTDWDSQTVTVLSLHALYLTKVAYYNFLGWKNALNQTLKKYQQEFPWRFFLVQ